MERAVANQVAAPAENTHLAPSATKSDTKEWGLKGGDRGAPAGEKTLSDEKTKRTFLTLTGLLMEGHFTF